MTQRINPLAGAPGRGPLVPLSHCPPDLLECVFPVEGRSAGCPLPDVDAVWVGHIRDLVAERLRSLGLDFLIEKAKLVVSELVTNAVLHGEGKTVRVEMRTSEYVCLEVLQGGSGKPRLRHAPPSAEHGRGLFLVDALTDDWGVRDSGGGITCWCRFSTGVTATSPERLKGAP
ncbi:MULTISPECIES: ATP-binding protein [unclassified Streptomyces]|uniref:ATP-binding protein n=1 Tax=unclassified Streptomyces TaxID=2593676 RepID=UPI0029B61AED|nr:ATP-binding protein [Streptomyces sp. DK15]MDX2395203.1 ATP-binding protein [Streptomyces sp. DK15]